MSQLFRRPPSKAAAAVAADPDPDPNSAYSSLLDPVSSIRGAPHQHRRTKSSPTAAGVHDQPRPWLSARPSAPAERPPVRKLVKEPGPGSARPSFSLELSSETDGAGKEKGFVRRGIERLKEIYRGGDRS